MARALASDGAVLQKEIDKDLKINKKVTSTEVKVLLLGKDARPCQSCKFVSYAPRMRARAGTGASGKSTIARQMKVLYMNGFTDKDASIFTEIIFFNIIKNMKVRPRWHRCLCSQRTRSCARLSLTCIGHVKHRHW